MLITYDIVLHKSELQHSSNKQSINACKTVIDATYSFFVAVNKCKAKRRKIDEKISLSLRACPKS